MTLWQQAIMSIDPDQRVQSDLQGQLEASHAEVAHMQKQIAATTAALHSARESNSGKVLYPAPGDPVYSEDSLIRSVCVEVRCVQFADNCWTAQHRPTLEYAKHSVFLALAYKHRDLG